GHRLALLALPMRPHELEPLIEGHRYLLVDSPTTLVRARRAVREYGSARLLRTPIPRPRDRRNAACVGDNPAVAETPRMVFRGFAARRPSAACGPARRSRSSAARSRSSRFRSSSTT